MNPVTMLKRLGKGLGDLGKGYAEWVRMQALGPDYRERLADQGMRRERMDVMNDRTRLDIERIRQEMDQAPELHQMRLAELLARTGYYDARAEAAGQPKSGSTSRKKVWTGSSYEYLTDDELAGRSFPREPNKPDKPPKPPDDLDLAARVLRLGQVGQVEPDPVSPDQVTDLARSLGRQRLFGQDTPPTVGDALSMPANLRERPGLSGDELDAPPTPTPGQPTTVNSLAEAQSLPDGALFIFNGQTYRKTGDSAEIVGG